ncbi:Nn.00g006190.m01.CDS01 [Neocucurbitaria sp. VM-36]
MATSSQHPEVRFAEQSHEDKPPSINQRLPRRASTLLYGAPAESSSDSESNEARITSSRSQKLAKHSSWYSRLRRARHGTKMKDSQDLTPPAPIHLARTRNDAEGVEERGGGDVDRPDGSVETVPRVEVRRAETFDVEKNRSSPPRARFDFRIPRVFSKKTHREDRSTTISGSSYAYYDYTTSSSAESSGDDEIAGKLMVYHCYPQASRLTTNRSMTRFDSAEHKPDVLGRERQAAEFRAGVTKAFTAAYTDEVLNAVKLVLIHNDQEAMSGLFRNVHSDSPWFATYGARLWNQIEPRSRHPQPRKTQLYRIQNDDKRRIAQGAICINHWVDPLPDDDEKEAKDRRDDSSSDDDTDTDDDIDTRTVGDNRLQQLIIYWQYRLPYEPAVQDEATTAREAIPVNNPDRIELATEKPVMSNAKSSTVPTAKSASNRKSKKSTTAPKDVEEWRETFLQSNMIVVFEKSMINSRNRKSIVLDDLSKIVTSGKLLVGNTSHINMYKFNRNLKGFNDIHSINDVIEKIFDSLEDDLNLRIDSFITQCARLDREVHRRPENDNIAHKLWLCSKHFQTVKKKIDTIAFLVDDIRDHLIKKGLSKEFLSTLPSKLKICANDVEEDLRKPVVEMIDLVYKSISINDSRRSMELNASLWRLSWVTFIFLPLTFLVGFFGMNVDIFADDPALKW